MSTLLESLRTWDERAFLWLYGFLHRRLPPWSHELWQLPNALGSAGVFALAAAAVLLLSPSHRLRVRRLASLMLAGGCVILAVQGLKALVERPRPYRVFSERFEVGELVLAYGEHASRGSFPSGHTATGFALATLIGTWAWRALPRRRAAVATAGLALGATLVGLSRVYAGMHFPVDVAAGALVGVVAGTLPGVFATLMRRRVRPGRPGPGPPGSRPRKLMGGGGPRAARTSTATAPPEGF